MTADFLHKREHLQTGNLAVLECDTQCNFMLMDDINFAAYRAGRGCKYYGGYFTHFPAQIAAPHTGYWNAVVDLGGGRANIRYSLYFIK